MSEKHSWLYDILFILVLLVAGVLRLTGVDWGEGMHQHPDELFLTGVLDALRAESCDDPSIPVDACPQESRHWLTPSEYFNTKTSPLNPYNRGYGFFVYGNLPMTITRVAAEALGKDGIGQTKFFSRQLSALADLLTIFLLYLIVSNLYGRRVGVLASLFSALSVMQIQQSHFFTSDLFVNLFMFLALAFAVKIVEWKEPESESRESGMGNGESALPESQPPTPESRLPNIVSLFRHPLFLLSIGFGLALGMAMASKINAAAMAIVLPGAFIVRYFIHDREKLSAADKQSIPTDYLLLITAFLIAGGLATIISFRIFQPYAFDGIGLNDQWMQNIAEQRAQANGDADLPWNLQWARRTHLFSFTNLTVWGLGLPLGILAWAGFLLMGWRILKGDFKHVLLWGWTAFYFLWQSMQFNATMRYQLPIYPLLCMMAAWVVFERPATNNGLRTMVNRLASIAMPAIGVIVLILTTIWAFAFQSIYLRPETRMAASHWIFQNVPAPVNMKIEAPSGAEFNQPLTVPSEMVIVSDSPYSMGFLPREDGLLSSVTFAHAQDSGRSPSTIVITVTSASNSDLVLGRASQSVNYASTTDSRGPEVTFTFDKPIPVSTGESYVLKIQTLGRDLRLSGSSIVNETDYDWGLPFRVDGYDPFGGMYRGDLNLQVYWDDNPDKLERYVSILDQADYIFIPTNHQYAQITRIPERYPLTTAYYRELLGCPKDMDIIKCYENAEPGDYNGRLGFELVQTFTSYPTLGPLVINDQSAEEAFTFYDHPKVFVFKKTADYDTALVRATLSAVDLTKVVHLTPKQAGNVQAQKSLMLPADRLAQQRAGGTWSDLFNYNWVQNKYPFVGAVIWYLFIFLLGLAAYPVARLALPGLGVHAYPLGRIVGIVLLAWISWMGGSVGIAYTRTSIGVVAALVAVTGIGLWMMRRQQYKDEWTANRRFFVIVEILFLVFFLIDLLIRLGNPDMWHPAKGGERPMDFSYFNAVLKSESFPPYDPWFAGGYINYYYYGFVLSGTPVKLLGIVPSIAYNLILPTWFAMVGIGAFTIAWNVVEDLVSTDEKGTVFDFRLVGGLSASLMTVILGNLGTIRLLFSGFQRVAAPGGVVPVDTTFIQKWIWAVKGVWMSFGGTLLPIARGDWYWFPSRVIPAPNDVEPITEFPLFTFLYGDPHAHMFVMPITLFILAWGVSFIKSRAKLTLAEWIATFGIGALMVGALKPTNTWDLYTYFPLAALALAYTLYRYFDWKDWFNIPSWVGRASVALGAVILLYVLGALLYYPFSYWYGQAYGDINPWPGSHTPISSYITHWGLFLFIIVFWLAWETREWMASTPVSHLKKLGEYALFIEIGIAVVIAALAYFLVEGARIAWVALPIAAWAGILLLRPNMPDLKRAVLMMIGTALVLTLAVEVVVLVGDIGRMNTVFKLYLQAWMLLSVSAACAFGWLFNVFPAWNIRWRTFYQAGLYTLFAGAFLFTLTATTDKISDRMNPTVPHTLDAMTFMRTTLHWDIQQMDLGEDYRAIRWMQDNVKGSPVIVEANCTEYRWCTRYTIYTGLPGVVGWNWHQRQQRASLSPTLVTDRVMEVGVFYSTPDIEQALAFLKKYQVKYIVVGQLEQNVYPPLQPSVDSFAKFTTYEGVYWKTVYHEGHTTIYEVIK